MLACFKTTNCAKIKSMDITQQKKSESLLIWIFVFVQSILFVLSHLRFEITTYLQFSSIVLSFVFCAFFANKSTLYLVGCFALFFTVCADFVLAFLPKQKELGMVFFCIVQTLYFIYILGQINGKQKHICIWARGAVVLVCEIVLLVIFKDIFNILAALVIFYFINLLFNTIFAFGNFANNKTLAIGFLLFVLCDIFVGFGQMSLFFDVSQSAFFDFVNSIPFNIAWTFYIPSQVLLSLAISKPNRI